MRGSSGKGDSSEVRVNSPIAGMCGGMSLGGSVSPAGPPEVQSEVWTGSSHWFHLV